MGFTPQYFHLSQGSFQCGVCLQSATSGRFSSVKGTLICGMCCGGFEQATIIAPLNEIKPELSKSKPKPKPNPYIVVPSLRYVAEGTSQKARGIQALKNFSHTMTLLPFAVARMIVDLAECKLFGSVGAEIKPQELVGKFVRPCPQKPRHGFVESRTVKVEADLDTIVEEIQATGEPVEFVIMDTVKAQCSAVWTRNHVAIGLGNDGATGLSQTETLALSPPMYEEVSAALAPPEGLETYLELVWPQGKRDSVARPYYVQARFGPVTTGNPDYVPHEIKVTSVITLTKDYDWQAWEAKCESLDPASGAVLSIPGSDLTCHAAVHAVAHGIPVLTSYVPIVGDVLQPNVNAGHGEAIMLGTIQDGFADAITDSAFLNPLPGLAAVHAFAGINLTRPRQARAFGWAVGKMVQSALACCGGEARYSKQIEDTPAWLKTFYGKHRDDVYTKVRTWDAYELIRHGTVWERMHALYPGAGFSGKKWATATGYAVTIARIFAQSVSEFAENFPAAVAEANKLAVCCHNGGRLFNKLVSSSSMDKASKNPCEFFAPLVMAEHRAGFDVAMAQVVRDQILEGYAEGKLAADLITSDAQQKTHSTGPHEIKGKFYIRVLTQTAEGFTFRVQVPPAKASYKEYTFSSDPVVGKAILEAIKDLPTAPSLANTEKVYFVVENGYLGLGDSGNIVLYVLFR